MRAGTCHGVSRAAGTGAGLTRTDSGSDKAMRQCFPRTWNEQYPDLIPGLKALVGATYTEGVPVRCPKAYRRLAPNSHADNCGQQLAWNDLAQSADFIAKANELDRLLEDAKARKARGEAPRNAYECVRPLIYGR